ncbi:MAG: TIM barrel protein [Dictyoglomi bacterium]|nr:TIM barrel protein [Dictyoglomota bacterium]
MLKISTAGIPLSAPDRSVIGGLEYLASLGLDGMELEFVRGVYLKPAMAEKVRYTAEKLGLTLTVHAPYWINFASLDEEKRIRSRKYLFNSAYIGYLAGATSVVFHPAWYQGRPSDEVLDIVWHELEMVLEDLDREGIHIDIRPELMGKTSQFGSLDELIKLYKMSGGRLKPCIDFAHLQARTIGKVNGYNDWDYVLTKLEKTMGPEILKDMHIHFSGIEFGAKGEIRHLPFAEATIDVDGWLSLMVDREIEGVVVVESPILEDDAMMLKNRYVVLERGISTWR